MPFQCCFLVGLFNFVLSCLFVESQNVVIVVAFNVILIVVVVVVVIVVDAVLIATVTMATAAAVAAFTFSLIVVAVCHLNPWTFSFDFYVEMLRPAISMNGHCQCLN